MRRYSPKTYASCARISRSPASRGFTLVEVMVTLPLVALLFGGTITLFTEGQRMVQRTSVAVQSSQDAAVGLQLVVGNTREAIQFSLPPDTANANTNGMSFSPPDGRVGDYVSSSGMNTAIELLMPSAVGLSVLDRNGKPIAPAGYDRTQTEISSGAPAGPLLGNLIWIYRGDAYGNPSPNTGQFLWTLTRPARVQPYDPSQDTLRKYCKLILTKHADGSAATDAVQFIGRYSSNNTDIPSSLGYEMEFKLVCGDSTSINGTQTNEATNGTSVSSLVGKCALLRNHN